MRQSKLNGLILHNNKYYCDIITTESFNRCIMQTGSRLSGSCGTWDGNIFPANAFERVKNQEDWIIIEYDNNIYLLFKFETHLLTSSYPQEVQVWNECIRCYRVITDGFKIILESNNPLALIEKNNNLLISNINLQNELNILEAINDNQLENYTKLQSEFDKLKVFNDNLLENDAKLRNELNKLRASDTKQLGIISNLLTEKNILKFKLSELETTIAQSMTNQLKENPFIKQIDIIAIYDYEQLRNRNIALHKEFKLMYKIFSKLLTYKYT